MNKIHSELVGEIRWSEIAYPWQMEVVRTAPMPGVEEFHLHLSAPAPTVPPELMLSWSVPSGAMHARWTADAAFLKLFPADYCGFFQSHLTSSAPVAVFPDNGGNNVLAFAFSELSRKVTFSAGLREETNCMEC